MKLFKLHRFASILATCLTLTTALLAEKKVTVGTVIDGPSAQWEAIRLAFMEELVASTEQEFVIQAPASKQWNGGWSAKGVAAALEKADSDAGTDIVLVLGFAASQQAALRKNFRKPTFAPFVAAALIGSLPIKDGASGIPNLNFLASESGLLDSLKVFQSAVPFQRAALLIDEAVFQSLSSAGQRVFEQARAAGIELVPVTHAGESDPVVKIPADVQAVVVGPLPRLKREDRPTLIDGLLSRKLPSFSLAGDADVADGFLLANASSVDLSRRTRQTALNIHAVLRGERAGDQPVLFERKSQVTVNMATARALGVAIKWQVLREATVLNEDAGASGVPLTISSAAQQAVRVNLDIIAGQLGVQAGAKEVSRVRSVLFPQIEGTLDWEIRREQYPVVSSGLAAKESLGGALRLNQIIFSESALANLSVQEKLQVALEAQQRTLELDIVQQTVNAYLSVLKSRTQLDVEKSGLRLAQENLQLAKSRVASGKADASDVSRWESEIANARQRVLLARSRVEQFRDQLNKLLRRPMGDRTPLAPTGLDDPQLLISRPAFFKTVDSDPAFDRLTSFFVQEATTTSPDVLELDARVRAQERQLVSDRRGHYLPDLNLWGEEAMVFDEERVPGATVPLDLENVNNWSLGANLSLPIFEGGGRMAKVAQSKAVLNQLAAQRDSLQQNVEQSVRDGLHALRASVPSIRLAQEGAEAAQRTYSLVSKGYARGTRSVVDLLDAQNANLQADLAAANAVYIAMTDLMNLQRSVGSFNYLPDPQVLDQTMQRLQDAVNPTNDRNP